MCYIKALGSQVYKLRLIIKFVTIIYSFSIKVKGQADISLHHMM